MIGNDYLKKRLPVRVEIFDVIDSSNEEAKRQIKNKIDDEFLIIAREQTAGKGRKGRNFYSPSNTGIYMTFTHFCDTPINDGIKVTVASSVFVRRAINKVIGIDSSIKWVNDLYYNDRKVCGILCGAILKNTFDNDKNAIIVGIGINLSTSDFPEDISGKAGSLLEKCEIDKIKNSNNGDASFEEMIIAEITEMLIEFFKTNDLKDYMDEYKEASMVLGKSVTLNDAKGVFAKGVIKDFDDNGAIVLEGEDGKTQIIDSGEISLFID